NSSANDQRRLDFNVQSRLAQRKTNFLHELVSTKKRHPTSSRCVDGPTLKTRSWSNEPDHARHWRDHWHGHFCADRHRRGTERRTCSCFILRAGGRSLNFRGALL